MIFRADPCLIRRAGFDEAVSGVKGKIAVARVSGGGIPYTHRISILVVTNQFIGNHRGAFLVQPSGWQAAKVWQGTVNRTIAVGHAAQKARGAIGHARGIGISLAGLAQCIRQIRDVAATWVGQARFIGQGIVGMGDGADFTAQVQALGHRLAEFVVGVAPHG